MRDPRAPIPSPTHDRGYWARSAPPPAPALRSRPTGSGDDDLSYDPTRLLRHRPGDVHGLDRRGGPRRRGQITDDPSQHLIGAAHRRIDAVLGLRTSQGWAIVRTLSLAPAGVLLHHLDLLDPELDAHHRSRGRQVLSALAPLMGAPGRADRPPPSSPLATVGTCVLSRRVVADVAAWATPTTDRPTPLTSARPSRRELSVTLVIPPPGAAPPRGGQPVAIVDGELVPLNDPDPQVLGVCLTPARVRQLELLLDPRVRARMEPSP